MRAIEVASIQSRSKNAVSSECSVIDDSSHSASYGLYVYALNFSHALDGSL